MLIGPAHTHRYRRFADALTGAHARLAEKRGWLVLRFSGLSPPILCQLAWRAAPFSPRWNRRQPRNSFIPWRCFRQLHLPATLFGSAKVCPITSCGYPDSTSSPPVSLTL